MSRRSKRVCWGAAIATGLVVATVALLPPVLQGFDSRPVADANGSSKPDKLVVHEWGTFTSFAGSDGVNFEFRSTGTSDLPPFILSPPSSRSYLSRLLGKQENVALQRMETPVTYFYTDRPRVVNVRVDFPRGLLTEWYPWAEKYDPGQQNADRKIVGHAFLDWGAVRLTPQEQFGDVRLKTKKGKIVPATLPRLVEGDHYGRARETDSAIVETVDQIQGSHFEKFLFYRGLGNFELPIKLQALGNDRFEVSNASAGASGALLLVRIEDGRVRFRRLDPLGPQSAIEASLPTTESTVDELAAATVRELTAAGLYEKESLAMVNTWRSSWFGEDGTRLFYLVPGKLTDELLPLKVEPSPDEQVRILVGRLETLTPEDCRRLVQAITASGSRDEPSAEVVQAELDSLGRFAEPALQFVIWAGKSATEAMSAAMFDTEGEA